MPVVQEGIFIPLLQEHPKIFAYERRTEEDSLIVLNNFFAEETEADLDLEGYEVYLSNYKDTEVLNHMVLRPYESVILKKK